MIYLVTLDIKGQMNYFPAGTTSIVLDATYVNIANGMVTICVDCDGNDQQALRYCINHGFMWDREDDGIYIEVPIEYLRRLVQNTER